MWLEGFDGLVCLVGGGRRGWVGAGFVGLIGARGSGGRWSARISGGGVAVVWAVCGSGRGRLYQLLFNFRIL